MRALLLVHQGSRLTAALSTFLRSKGYEPYVVSSAASDGGEAFRAVCAEMGLAYDMHDTLTLDRERLLRTARELEDCRFCLGVWDGHRTLMAEVNGLLGAHDDDPEAIRQTVDKHRMRLELAGHGLTGIDTFRLDDPELRARLERGERHIVKPRRGAGSLCVRKVASWDELVEHRALYDQGVSEDDMFVEYYAEDNELIAETFFEGRELSFEMVRQNGHTALACDNERTVLTHTERTVLERGFASPPIRLSADEVRLAKEHADRCMDALGMVNGCYHVEVSVGPDGRTCEIIEINPRPGGQFMVDSVRLQLGRVLGDDWIDVMLGNPVPDAGERTQGIYYQAHYREPGRQVLATVRDPDLPEPTMFNDFVKAGQIARADREELGAQTLWTTDLATHQEFVQPMVQRDYATFVYAKGLSGRPLFLVFEPTNHIFQVVEAADRLGYDVVVFHTLPVSLAGPYNEAWRNVALLHTMENWDDVEANLAEVLETCGDAKVAGTYCAVERVLELEARVQEHYGLPTKGSAETHELLNKVNVRRRLVEAGLSKLRLFQESEVDALRDWPVGERALYFKPVHGAGSAFVKRCADLEEVRAAIADWKAADKASIPVLGAYLDSEGGAFFLEEEAPGELLSVEGYVFDGEFTSIGLCSRVVLAKDPITEMGASFPFEHPRHDEIVGLVAHIHEVVGVRHGVTHTEVKVPDEGPIELVELNLRFIGADVLKLIDLACDIRFEDDLVRLAVGEPPVLQVKPTQFAHFSSLLAPPGLTKLESFELPSDVEYPLVKMIRPIGSELASTDRQLDWIAAFVITAPTHQEMLDLMVDVRRRTLVNGEPLADNPNNVLIGH
jgi:biotin carboxylase